MFPWDRVPVKVRRQFLDLSSPDKVKISEHFPTISAPLFLPLQEGELPKDYLPPLAESFRHALMTCVEGFAVTHLDFRYSDSKDKSTSSVKLAGAGRPCASASALVIG